MTRTLAEELPRLPDPTAARARLFLSSPPWPAGGRRRGSISDRARKEPAACLCKGGVAISTEPCSDHRSQRRRREIPRIQIWLLRPGYPHPGKRPCLRKEDDLQTTRTPAPLLHLPPPAKPARLASDRPRTPVEGLRNCRVEESQGGDVPVNELEWAKWINHKCRTGVLLVSNLSFNKM
jgi:hypothetical protein